MGSYWSNTTEVPENSILAPSLARLAVLEHRLAALEASQYRPATTARWCVPPPPPPPPPKQRNVSLWHAELSKRLEVRRKAIEGE